MSNSPLVRMVDQLRRELHAAAAGGEGLPELRRAIVDLRLRPEEHVPGEWRFQPVVADTTSAREEGATALRLEFEFEARRVSKTRASAPTAPVDGAADELPHGGDLQTLRRRLEILLGGPPGFNSGAKAGILSDLLMEFGRPALLEMLQREWVREFDTGAEASPSVTRPPS